WIFYIMAVNRPITEMDYQEIYLLITGYLSQQTTSDENEKLADWIRLSKENEAEFEQIKTIWMAGANSSDEMTALNALAKTRKKYGIPQTGHGLDKKPIRSYSRWHYWSAAAAVILAIFFLRTPPSSAPKEIVYIEKTTLPKQK